MQYHFSLQEKSIRVNVKTVENTLFQTFFWILHLEFWYEQRFPQHTKLEDMAKLVNIMDHFDDSPSASDQEELVGATDFDDDLTDVDELPYSNYCKSGNERTSAGSDSGVVSGSDQPSNYIVNDQRSSKCRLFGSIIALFLAAFALLITFPLYLQQLAVEGEKNNAYGAILYVSTTVTAIFIMVAACASYFGKWNVKWYKCPISWRR